MVIGNFRSAKIPMELIIKRGGFRLITPQMLTSLNRHILFMHPSMHVYVLLLVYFYFAQHSVTSNLKSVMSSMGRYTDQFFKQQPQQKPNSFSVTLKFLSYYILL